MSDDHEAEIRASVGAHRDLGPGYDDAVAEGLVERIGAEIDKRIDARLERYGPQYEPVPPEPAAPPVPMGPSGPAMPQGPVMAPGLGGPPGPFMPPGPGAASGPGAAPGYPGYQGYQGYQAPAGYPPPGHIGYQGYQGYQQPMLPPGYPVSSPGPKPPQESIGSRSVATTITALGSMALGVGATAIVSHGPDSGGKAAMVLLIWAAIVIINIAYARRP
jgi:hypothetical protein